MQSQVDSRKRIIQVVGRRQLRPEPQEISRVSKLRGVEEECQPKKQVQVEVQIAN